MFDGRPGEHDHVRKNSNLIRVEGETEIVPARMRGERHLVGLSRFLRFPGIDCQDCNGPFHSSVVWHFRERSASGYVREHACNVMLLTHARRGVVLPKNLLYRLVAAVVVISSV